MLPVPRVQMSHAAWQFKYRSTPPPLLLLSWPGHSPSFVFLFSSSIALATVARSDRVLGQPEIERGVWGSRDPLSLSPSPHSPTSLTTRSYHTINHFPRDRRTPGLQNLKACFAAHTLEHCCSFTPLNRLRARLINVSVLRLFAER